MAYAEVDEDMCRPTAFPASGSILYSRIPRGHSAQARSTTELSVNLDIRFGSPHCKSRLVCS